MMHFYSNKVAVITGAASGLGRALAVELYQSGCRLALLDIHRQGLEDLKSALEKPTQRISIHVADVAEESEVARARTAILDIHTRVDILINNAGVSISRGFDQLDTADFKRLFEVNFWGTVHCSKHFLGDLSAQPDSRLANIISGFALMGFPGKTAYGSSKSAIMGFSNALSTELGHQAPRVSLVIPPPLHTGIVRHGQHTDPEKQRREDLFLQQEGMPLPEAARKIASGIAGGKFRIVVGPMMFWTDFFFRLFPTGMHRLIVRNRKRFDFIP